MNEHAIRWLTLWTGMTLANTAMAEGPSAAPGPSAVATPSAPTAPAAAAPAAAPAVAAPEPAAAETAAAAPAAPADAAPAATPSAPPTPTDAAATSTDPWPTITPPPTATPAPVAAPAVVAPSTAPGTTSSVAQYHHVPFDIGLVPGLSINGRHQGKRVRNNFSIAFGWTRAARVDGIATGLGATVVDEEMQGIAASLGANITRGVHRGVQFTHGYNYAADLRGVQMGGINRAPAVRGMQFGLINIGGKVEGAQVGLINWARSADASFALLPITREGGVRFEASSSDTALLNVGIRLPAKYTYAFAGAGIHPFGTERGHTGTNLHKGKAWEFGGGFGGHIPVTDEIFIDIDLSSWGVTSGLRSGAKIGGLNKARFMVGWQAAPRVAIFGGPTFNVLVDRAETPDVPLRGGKGVSAGTVERPGYGWVAYERTHGNVRVRMWPGFVAGVRF